MPLISRIKKDKISEHILSLLFDKFPEPMFTSEVAQEIARDEEFTRTILEELKDKQLATPIQRNPQGVQYKRRIRWRLSTQAHSSLKSNKFL